jgi:aspartate/methionine/tyrosine aminotransferase
MIKPADRTQLVQEYYFSQKLKAIEQMNKEGKNVINLGIGNPDQLPPQNALDEFVAAIQTYGIHGYQSYVGIPELRNAFATWYNTFYNVELDSKTEILPLMGSKEGIMHISMAFLNPGDKVLIPNPGYPTYRAVSLIVGAEVVDYDLKPKNNWYPDFHELEKLDLTGVKLMWVNYPHMPTGQPASLDIFQKLIDFGKKHSILICNDNPYSFILNDKPLSILSITGAKDIALELNSLSKSHNMAGFRVGMVAGNSELIGYVLKIKSNMDSGMYKPLQMAAVKALGNPKTWYNSINKEYKIRRELVWKLFDILGAQYDKAQTGMFIWARIPEKYKHTFEFCDMILDKANVFITPGAIFGSNGDNFARISLCSSSKLLNEAIERIEKHIVKK